MIEIIERHMAGGNQAEHIAEVKYIMSDGETIACSTREQIVSWLDQSKENKAIVRSTVDSSNYSYVGVVHRDSAADYIRTYADGYWNDNLLALKEY